MSKLGWNISSNRRTHVVLRFGYVGQTVSCRPWRANNLSAKAGDSVSSDDDGGRLSNLFKMYESEQEGDGKVYVGSTANKEGKKRRHKSKSLYTRGMEENDKKHKEYFYRVSDGTWKPRVGVYGKGEPRWWALRVTIGREKQTCTAIERRYQQLREAASPEDAELMQDIETWDIWKRVRAWNPKNEKMGNKMIRYGGGGWVLVRAIMDDDVAKILRGNINILGFHHREVYNGEEFPVPVEDDLLAALTEWQEDLQPISEEQVREEMGLPPPIQNDFFFDVEEGSRGRKGRDTMDRKKRQGLFSSNEDDSWGGDTDTWYSGSFSDESDSNVSWLGDTDNAFFEQFSDKKEDSNDSDELSAWLGDFNDGASDDWSSLDDQEESRPSKPTSKSAFNTDDLSWWDEEPNEQNKTNEELHAFTDEETVSSYQSDTPTSDDIPSGGTPIEIVGGAFKDFEGFILEDNPASEKLKAEIDVFGKPTVVEVLREDVEYL